jgi:NAD(P)-dependent dehydrogenase (short-subunit alcohol dehydrogenase family)
MVSSSSPKADPASANRFTPRYSRPVGRERTRRIRQGASGGSGWCRTTRTRADLSTERYRRAVAVNVAGVVFGVRRLAQAMHPADRIVAMSSLAGLTAMPHDPIYAATKHAMIGFVRSAAPTLATKGIALNAVCPGTANTSLLTRKVRERFLRAGFPLLEPRLVADAVWVARESENPVKGGSPSGGASTATDSYVRKVRLPRSSIARKTPSSQVLCGRDFASCAHWVGRRLH